LAYTTLVSSSTGKKNDSLTAFMIVLFSFSQAKSTSRIMAHVKTLADMKIFTSAPSVRNEISNILGKLVQRASTGGSNRLSAVTVTSGFPEFMVLGMILLNARSFGEDAYVTLPHMKEEDVEKKDFDHNGNKITVKTKKGVQDGDKDFKILWCLMTTNSSQLSFDTNIMEKLYLYNLYFWTNIAKQKGVKDLTDADAGQIFNKEYNDTSAMDTYVLFYYVGLRKTQLNVLPYFFSPTNPDTTKYESGALRYGEEHILAYAISALFDFRVNHSVYEKETGRFISCAVYHPKYFVYAASKDVVAETLNENFGDVMTTFAGETLEPKVDKEAVKAYNEWKEEKAGLIKRVKTALGTAHKLIKKNADKLVNNLNKDGILKFKKDARAIVEATEPESLKEEVTESHELILIEINRLRDLVSVPEPTSETVSDNEFFKMVEDDTVTNRMVDALDKLFGGKDGKVSFDMFKALGDNKLEFYFA
jgi:hypothetical protein